MSKPVSTAQSHAIIQALATNVDWSLLDGDKLQKEVVKNSKEAGKRLTEFLLNGCQFLYVGEIRKLALDEDFNPAAFIGEGNDYWKGPLDGDGLTGETWIDPRAMAMTEFDPTQMIFKTCLKEQEKSIKGVEKFRRLVEKEPDFIRYDLRVFLALWKDYQKYKENSLLEMFYRTQKVEYIDFMVPLRYPRGRCCILYFDRSSDGRWHWSYYWLDLGWGARFFSVGCASSLRNSESQG